MKQKLESIIQKGKIFALAGLIALPIGCASMKNQYIKPQIGVISPVAEKKQDYDSSSTIGVAYGFNIGKIGLEVGLDSFKSSEEYIKTDSTLSRLNISYNLLKPTAKVRPYLIGGVNFLRELSTIDIPKFDVHEEVTNTTSGIEFGIGATIKDGIDGRITYTVLPTSENVKGMISLTIGYRFLFGGKK